MSGLGALGAVSRTIAVSGKAYAPAPVQVRADTHTAYGVALRW